MDFCSNASKRLMSLYRRVLVRNWILNQASASAIASETAPQGRSRRERHADEAFADLEQLDSRVHLALTNLISGNTAFITGDAASDVLALRVNANNELEYSLNGGAYTNDLSTNSPGVQTFVVNTGKDIFIQMNAGDDRLILPDASLRNRLGATGATLFFDGGAGGLNDTVSVSGFGANWTITGTATGKLDNNTQFSNIEVIRSGSSDDQFTLSSTDQLSISIIDAGGKTTISSPTASLFVNKDVLLQGPLEVSARDEITVGASARVSTRPASESDPINGPVSAPSYPQTWSADSITVAAGGIVTASGSGPLPAGDITMKATDRFTSPIPTLGINAETATITIRGTVSGANVSLIADAADLVSNGAFGRVFNNLTDNTPNNGENDTDQFPILELLGEAGNSVITTLIPVIVMRKRSVASITLEGSGRITGTGTVLVNARSTSDATEEINPPFLSVGYSYASSDARVTLKTGSRINTNGSVIIATDASSIAKMDAETATALGAIPGDPLRIAAALAISTTNTTSKIIMEPSSIIDAGLSANLDANGYVEGEGVAQTGAFQDGRGAVAVGLRFNTSDISSEIAGRITTFAPSAELVVNVDPSAVSTSQDTIRMPGHGFRTGQPLTYNKPGGSAAIGGLKSGETYYVIATSDPDVIRLAETARDAFSNDPLNLTSAGGAGVHTFEPSLTTGIGVRATLAAEEKAEATAGFGTSGLQDVAQDVLYGDVDLADLIGAVASQASAAAPAKTNANTSLGAAGALSLLNTDQSVRVIILPTATLFASGGNADIASSLEEKYQTSTEATVDSDPAQPTRNAAAAAVSIAKLKNRSKTELQTGARLDVTGDLKITSDLTYPFVTEPKEAIEEADFITKPTSFGDFRTRLGETLDGKLGFSGKVFNTWTRSTGKATNFGISGSFTYVNFDNAAEALVRSGVSINRNESNAPTQSVTVAANTKMRLVNMAGVFALDLSPSTLTGLITGGDRWATLKNMGGPAAKGGLGGSVYIQNLTNVTTAKVDGDARVTTGVDQMLTVEAKEDMQNFVLVQSGGRAQKFGVSGSVAYTDTETTTTAQIGSGFNFTGGGIAINANSSFNQLDALGSTQSGGNLGVGAIVGLNDLTRNVNAILGEPEGTTPGSSNITTRQGVSVTAKSTGNLSVFSVAAALTSTPPPSGAGQTPDNPPAGQNNDPLDGESLPNLFGDGQSTSAGSSNSTYGDKGKQGTGGIAISGDVSIQDLTDNVVALINDDGSIAATYDFNVDPSAAIQQPLVVSAENATNVVSATGAVAISTNTGNSAGLAGSISSIKLTGATSAKIMGGLTVNGQASNVYFDVKATRSGIITAGSAGGSGALAQTGYSVAGSVSVLKITNTTDASIQNTTITGATSVSLSATDASKIIGIAGALSYGGRAGIGAAVSLNVLSLTTRSRILGGTSINQTRTSVIASNTAEIASIAGAAAAGRSAGIAGTVAINRITGTTEASLSGLTQTPSGTLTPSTTLRATNSSTIDTISGAFGVSTNVGFGGALSYNKIANTTKASISNSTLRGRDSISLTASSTAAINSIAAGAAGSQQTALAGSVAINQITNTTDATIDGNSSITVSAASKSLTLSSTDSSTIRTLAGAVAGGGRAGVGASVAVNLVNNATGALISGSTASLQDWNVSLAASETATIESISAAGSGAGTFAGGGGVSVNNIGNLTQARVLSSTISAGDVRATATDRATINALSGGVAGGGTASIGASVGVNIIGDTTRAQVSSSSINANGGDVVLTSDTSAQVNAITAAAAAAGTATISGSVSTTSLNNITETLVDGASTITATDTVLVGASDVAGVSTLAGNVAGAGTGALGASVATVVSSSRTQALVTNSTLRGDGDSSTGQIGRGTGVSFFSDQFSSGNRQTQTYFGVAVVATSFENIVNLAAGLTGSGSAGLAGSVSLVSLDEKTFAKVDDRSKINHAAGGGPGGLDVTLLASDRTDLLGVAGAAAGGGSAGIGAGADIASITKTTEAQLSSADTRANRVLQVLARNSEVVTSVSAAGGGGGSAGIAGSAGVQVHKITTTASISDNDTTNTLVPSVNSLGSVLISADHFGEMDRFSGSAGVGGSAGIGAAVGVPIITNTTEAYVGPLAKVVAQGLSYAGGGTPNVVTGNGTFDRTSVTGGSDRNVPVYPGATQTVKRPEVVAPSFARNSDLLASNRSLGIVRVTPITSSINGVAISAINRNDIETVDVAGSGGGSAAISASAEVLQVTATTRAYIGSQAQVNQNAVNVGGLLIAAGNALYSLNVSGAGAISGTASISPGVNIIILNDTTQAYVDTLATVSARQNSTIRATNSQDIISIAASISGSGYIAVGGSVSVLKITDSTEASVRGQAKVTLQPSTTLSILAIDRLQYTDVNGSGGLGLGAGGLAASVGVSLIDKTTQSFVASAAEITGGLLVNANSNSDLYHMNVSGAGGFYGGIAGSVNFTNLTGVTTARILDNAKVNVGAASVSDVSVQAVSNARSRTIQGTIGGGLFGGVGGAVDVGIFTLPTTASIGAGANVRAANLTVNATGVRDFGSTNVSVGAGGVGLAGSVVVYSLASALDQASKDALAPSSSSTSTGSFIDSEVVAKSSRDLLSFLGVYSTTDRNGSDPAPDGASLMSGIATSSKNTTNTAAVTNSATLIGSGGTRDGVSVVVAPGATLSYEGSAAFNATGQTTVSVVAGAAGVGLIGLGGAVILVTAGENVSTTLSGTITGPTASGGITASSQLTQSLTGQAYAGTGGALALGAQYTKLTDTSNTTTTLDATFRTVSANDLAVRATSTHLMAAQAAGGSLGGVAAGISFASATVAGSTRAAVLTGATLGTNVLGTVDITARSTSTPVARAIGVAAGTIGATGAIATAISAPVVEATLGDNVTLSGSRNTRGLFFLRSFASSGASAQATGVAVATTGALGVTVAVATNTPSVVTTLGAGTTIVGSSLDIRASENVADDNSLQFDKAATATATAGAGALFAGGAGSLTTATNSPNVRVNINAGARITSDGTMSIISQATNLAGAQSTGDALGGLLAVGLTSATATARGRSSINIGTNTVINSTNGSVFMTARSYDAAGATSRASAGGLLAGGANLASATTSPTILLQLEENVDITAKYSLNLNANNEVHATSDSVGAVTGVAAIIGTSESRATASPTVQLLVGRRADLESTAGTVSLFSLNNMLYLSGATQSQIAPDAAVATSSASLAGILGSGLPSSITVARAWLAPETIIGDNVRIVAGSDALTPDTSGNVFIVSEVGTGTRLSVSATAGGLFTRTATEGSSFINSYSKVDIGMHSRVQARSTLTLLTRSLVQADSTITGGGGATITDFLRSLFSGNISDALNNIPSIVSGGGSISRIDVGAESLALVRDFVQLVAGDIDVKSVVQMSAFGLASMESKGAFKADATSVSIVGASLESKVDISADTELSARTIKFTADTLVGGSAIAVATTNVSIGGANASGLARFEVTPRANIRVSYYSKVLANNSVALNATVRQLDANKLTSEGRAKASGGIVGTARSLAAGTVVPESQIELVTGSVVKAKSVTINARSTIELDRKPIALADTAVSRFVERVREVTRSVTKWLPWPLSSIVEFVVSRVVDVVEVFDFSNATGVQGGYGVTPLDRVTQRGTIQRFDATERRLTIAPVASPIQYGYRAPDGDNNIGYTVTPQGVLVDDVPSDDEFSFELNVPFGVVDGDGEIIPSSITPRIEIIDNSDQPLYLQGLQMVRQNDDPQIRINAASGSLKVNKDVVHSSLVITDNGAGDIILTQSISNVAADITIIAQGNIYSTDPSIFIEGGDVGLLRLEAGGNIGSQEQRLQLRTLHGKTMPDGSPAMMQSRVSLEAGGEIVVDVHGGNAVYQQTGDYSFEVDDILFDALANGNVDIVVSETVILDDRNEPFFAEGRYQFTNIQSLTGDIRLDVAAGDSILGTISAPGHRVFINAERGIFADSATSSIVADELVLVSGRFIGTAAAPIISTVRAMYVGASRGDVFVLNHGDLSLENLGGFVSFGGYLSTHISAEGSITLRSGIESVNDISLTAIDALDRDASIHVEAGNTLISNEGSIALTAGDDIIIPSTVIAAGLGRVDLVADQDAFDPQTGATIHAEAYVGSPQASIQTGAGDDTVDLSLAYFDAQVHISTGDGNDTITGNPNTDIINPGAGNDRVNGFGGSDQVLSAQTTDRLLAGKIDQLTSVDTFCFSLSRNQAFSVRAIITDGDLITQLAVTDPRGRVVARGLNALKFVSASAGDYILSVASNSGTGAYRLSFSGSTKESLILSETLVPAPVSPLSPTISPIGSTNSQNTNLTARPGAASTTSSTPTSTPSSKQTVASTFIATPVTSTPSAPRSTNVRIATPTEPPAQSSKPTSTKTTTTDAITSKATPTTDAVATASADFALADLPVLSA